MERRTRKKSWQDKCDIVAASFNRILRDRSNIFAKNFYNNLIYLNPKIEEYFKDTDFEHQQRLLLVGLQYMIDYTDSDDENAKKQIIRLARVHSEKNLGIHPHHYYYWVEALIMTLKKADKDWYDDMEFYWREVIYFPVTFFISQYYK